MTTQVQAQAQMQLQVMQHDLVLYGQPCLQLLRHHHRAQLYDGLILTTESLPQA
eukprot:COSAG02_NODE_843_length_16599_cov_6.528485_17_plen_54_part_00